MHIQSILVSQFRNLSTQSISFSEKCCLICGQNGQGKTSILEAIFTAAHARSFRTTRLRELICWESDSASVQLKIDTVDGVKDLECVLSPGRKKISLNGNPIEKASSYYGQITCIAFTPESMQLVQGGPLIRRRFIDRSQSMINPLSVDILVQYQRALKSRNSILAEHRKDIISGSCSLDIATQLSVWEELLARYGTKIINQRNKFIISIEPLMQQYYQLLSKGKEVVSLTYASSVLSKNSENIEEYIQEKLNECRRDDAQRLKTSVGPHRDELEISVDFGIGSTKPARQTASQGQSRSIALALTLAVVELITELRAEPPVVLLDDVESELDISRREALFEVLSSFESQTIITATEASSALLRVVKKPSLLIVNSGKIGLLKQEEESLKKVAANT